MLARWLTPQDGTLWRQSSYRFHALVATRWRSAPGVVLAGDAAHMQPPLLGQARCQGVRDAVNLAWKLAAVAQGRVQHTAAKTLLDSDSHQRKAPVSALTSRLKARGAVICERDVDKARAPDGFTFYFATTAALVTNPLLFKTLPYDPAKDVVPVAFAARSPFALLVRADSPIKTVDDVVARSRLAPGSLSLGNEGPRTFSGMVVRLFNARTQAAANLVPYANVGVGTQDLMDGHVDALVADLASTAQLARQGKLRVLATAAARRVAGWHNVPALAQKTARF